MEAIRNTPAGRGAVSVVVSLLWFGFTAASSQSLQDPLRNPFKPPTFNEIMGDQARELGSQLDARNRMAAERARQIRDYTNRLEACGNCAQRAELQKGLDHWRQADALVNQVEHAALSTMGLGRYRNIGELQVGMLEELLIASQQVAAQQRQQAEIGQIAVMVGHECKKKHAVQRKEGCSGPVRGEALREFNLNVQACRTENDPLRLYANDQMVRTMCGQQADPGRCIAENSIVTKARAYNTAAAEQEVRDRLEGRLQKAELHALESERKAAERARNEELRELKKTMTPQERSAQQKQYNAERAAQIKERTRARRECENG